MLSKITRFSLSFFENFIFDISFFVVYNVFMQSVNENISNNLIKLRKSFNLTQSELADKIGYTDKTISRWENGTTVPDIQTLIELSEFYGISITDLISEESATKFLKEERIKNYVMMTLSVLTSALICVLLYLGLMIIGNENYWQVWILLAPICSISAYFYNKKYLHIKWLNIVLLSIINVGAVTWLFFQLFEFYFWQLFFVCIPIEGMIIVRTIFSKYTKKNK